MNFDTTRILSLISLLFLFWPLFYSKKNNSEVSKFLSLFFGLRIGIELLGYISKLFELRLIFQYHFFVLLEFQILLLILHKIKPFQYYKYLAAGYTIFWIVIRFFSENGFLQSFNGPVESVLWVSTVILLVLWGNYLLRYNFRKGIKENFIILGGAVVFYICVIGIFILYSYEIKNSVMSAEMMKKLLRERYFWNVGFMLISTVFFVLGIKYLPHQVEKK